MCEGVPCDQWVGYAFEPVAILIQPVLRYAPFAGTPICLGDFETSLEKHCEELYAPVGIGLGGSGSEHATIAARAPTNTSARRPQGADLSA